MSASSNPVATLRPARLDSFISQAAVVQAAWIVVAAAAVLRAIVAARLPLSGDEAYYWEWSRRLAFGYIDHPPMVAWLIALFTLGSKSVFLIRLPFVLCGLGAAIALGSFAARATRDARAGAAAALLLSLAPFATIAFTMAAPDGPELFFWSIALYFALRALDSDEMRWKVLLALALAGALMSSVLGAFLAAGTVTALALANGPVTAPRSSIRRRAGALAGVLVFALAVLPYFLWNASHEWHGLRFALFGRHTFVPGGNFLSFLGVSCAVLTPGVFVAMFWACARLVRGPTPVERLLLATCAPLLLVCVALSLREYVEFNWADGAFVTLVGALGFYAPRALGRRSFALVAGPAAALAALLFVIGLWPMQSLRLAEQTLGVHLRNQGAFEIWAFEPAARDVAREARASGAMVMTDGYGLSSVLDFYADVPPVVIGYDRQGREARRWFDGRVRRQGIFFDKEPLASRPDFREQFARACSAVEDDGSRTYYLDGQKTRTFYLTRCLGLTPAGFSLLFFGSKG